MFKCKKFTIIYGHYGCGKTNLSLNLALMLAREGNPVTLVDLDIVNPYFRSSDYKGLFEGLDVEVVSPQFAGTNLDLPSLPAEIYSVFNQAGRYVIMDIGGDDAGAYALGRFAGQIESLADYEAYYVVNKYRALTQSPQEAAGMLSEIEAASRVKATGIINNSHLQGLTTAEDILASAAYAQRTAAALSLPLVMTTATKDVAQELEGKIEGLYPVEVIVRPPFE